MQLKFRVWGWDGLFMSECGDNMTLGDLKKEGLIVMPSTGFKDRHDKEIYFDDIIKLLMSSGQP